MKAVGVIVEYNPFHNGHKLHYERAKKYGDIVIAVMSGDFLQRGEPALIDRWKRAEIALKNGVDLVVELPIFYSTQSAEIFARGGIGILKALKVKTVVFGSETGDIERIKFRAKLAETEEFKERLKYELKSGVSYPTAFSNCLKFFKIEEEAQSNDILGIEYIKSIEYWGGEITPVAIKRESTGYYSNEIKGGIASATGIRNRVFSKESIENLVPDRSYEILNTLIDENRVCRLEDFYPLIRYRILSSKESLKEIQDIEEGYLNRLYEVAKSETEFCNFFESIKSKRYTLGRIQRILIHILLDITKEMTEKTKVKIPYVRVLGFNKKGQKYLKSLKDEEVKIFTTLKNIQKKLEKEELALLEKNENASKIYAMINPYIDRKIPIMVDEDE